MPITISSRLPDPGDSCVVVDDPDQIEERYESLRYDESRIDSLVPQRIFFPESTEQLAWSVRRAIEFGGGITVSGARTGIVGGATVYSENLISTEKIKGELSLVPGENRNTLICGAGTTLDEVREFLATSGDRYPVDPTESTATVGGTVATNASGARTLKHGPTRDWVVAASVVLANGRIVDLQRGGAVSDDCVFDFAGAEGTLRVEAEPVVSPQTKHNAGYAITKPMDAIDLFIGSEGTLGIVGSVVLALDPLPDSIIGLTMFISNLDPVPIVEELASLEPAAIEYMDDRSLRLLAEARELGVDGGAIPEIPEEAVGAIYVEFELVSEDALEACYGQLEEILLRHEIDPDTTWGAFEQEGILDMKRFRHALPERINSILGARKLKVPELRKIGTDMAVPLEGLPELMDHYRSSLSKLGADYAIFGHIGDGHLHVNIIPKSLSELEAGHELYREFAKHAVELGGSVVGEHGIGRIKRDFLEIQYTESQIASMQMIKNKLDPDWRLNPGVLFAESYAD